MKLRPYHNPHNADESLVPDGWRMLYADEFPLRRKVPCRLFVKPYDPSVCPQHFDLKPDRGGKVAQITYIVPVTP
jgi:hypothetical protein